MCCSAQRRWQRCDKQQAAVFYFPFSICYFLLLFTLLLLLLLLPQIHAKIIFWHLSGGNEGLSTSWWRWRWRKVGGACALREKEKKNKSKAEDKRTTSPKLTECTSGASSAVNWLPYTALDGSIELDNRLFSVEKELSMWKKALYIVSGYALTNLAFAT